MLSGIFSFRGRITRRQYGLGSLGIGIFVAVVCLAPLVLGGGPGPADAASIVARLGLMVLLAIPTLVIAAWVGFSLQARRIRDIGLDPVIVMPLWIAVAVGDKVLTPGFPHLGALQLLMPSDLGALVNLAGGAALCLWPSRRDAPRDFAADLDPPDLDDDPSRYQSPAAVQAAYARIDAERAPPQPPREAVAPTRFSQASAPGGFGRRGL